MWLEKKTCHVDPLRLETRTNAVNYFHFLPLGNAVIRHNHPHHALLIDTFNHGLFRLDIKFLVELQIGYQKQTPFDEKGAIWVARDGIQTILRSIEGEIDTNKKKLAKQRLKRNPNLLYVDVRQ